MLKTATMIRKLKNTGKAPRSAFCLLLSAYCLLFSAGCRRDMQDQPKMKAFRTATFFGDGLSARPPVENTIPRGYLRADTALFTGKKTKPAAASPVPAGPQPTAAAPGGAGQIVAAYPD